MAATASPSDASHAESGAATPRRRRRRSPALAVSLVLMVATVIGLALVLAAAPLMQATGLRVDGGQPTIAPSVFAPPTPTPVPSATGDGVIEAPAPASPSATLVPAKLSSTIKAIERKQAGTNAALVIDLATGKPVYSENAATMLIPASNMKTLVALAVLEALGDDHRFVTSAVRNASNQVVLVGGGDPYLQSTANPLLPPGGPTLDDLATQTATALKASGTTSITLAVDDTMFTGPAWNPAWPQDYRDQVTPISALMVDGGRVLADGKPVAGQPRATDAGLDAATRFAALLKARGITVTGNISRTKATGAPVATVKSLPLELLVTHFMVVSDNTAAEMLLRHIALASKQPGSFAGGATALQTQLSAVGVWQSGAVIQDGSGLSRGNRVSAQMLGNAWLHISKNEALRGVLIATPVAGVSGTLRDRFFDPGAAAGRGLVHAKTGTLREVSTLSGWTVTRDGQPLVVVLMVNGSTNDWFARIWIDQTASAVTACGCR